MKPPARPSRLFLRPVWLVVAILLAQPTQAQDEPLVLLVQPTRTLQAARRDFSGLLAYLEQATGRKITVTTAPNFLAHWQTVRRNAHYDLVLDEAHFTDYRVQKFGFHVLAKIPGIMSYSLATLHTLQLRSPLDLAGKTIASFGPPSIGAMRLDAMFPNPARRPVLRQIENADEGLKLLRQGTVAAVMLPTSTLRTQADNGVISALTTAEPTPNLALSLSPRIDTELRESLRTALLRLDSVDDGKKILRDAGIDTLEPATAADYAGQSKILRAAWGY